MKGHSLSEARSVLSGALRTLYSKSASSKSPSVLTPTSSLSLYVCIIDTALAARGRAQVPPVTYADVANCVYKPLDLKSKGFRLELVPDTQMSIIDFKSPSGMDSSTVNRVQTALNQGQISFVDISSEAGARLTAKKPRVSRKKAKRPRVEASQATEEVESAREESAGQADESATSAAGSTSDGEGRGA